MTRVEEIEKLRRRLAVATEKHKQKDAGIIYARLKSLMTRQLNAENRKAKAA